MLEEQLRLVAETAPTKTLHHQQQQQSAEIVSQMRRIFSANNTTSSFASSAAASPSSASSSGEEDAYPAAEMLQKLSLHDSGIERLRRDISQLQLGRTLRQSSMIQSGADCGCPAGE